ncbi:MAG: hypothetical protein ACJ71R_01515 [Nitrososphaeraceae archaeon]
MGTIVSLKAMDLQKEMECNLYNGIVSWIYDRIPNHGLGNQIPLPGLGFAGY